jgi:uncharacterized protein (DUF1015 family)
MVRIQPFAAVRPLPSLAARVASVPYDVVNTDEARQLAADNPYSFLRVIRSEIDLPPETDPHDAVVYAAAAERFQKLLGSTRTRVRKKRMIAPGTCWPSAPTRERCC